MLVRHQVLAVLAGAAVVRAQAAAANGTTLATTVQTTVQVSHTASSNASTHLSSQTATATRTAATQVTADASETEAAELGWGEVKAPSVPTSQQYTVAVSRGRSFSRPQEGELIFLIYSTRTTSVSAFLTCRCVRELIGQLDLLEDKSTEEFWCV